MSILDELLSGLDTRAAVLDIRVGPFQTAVVTRNCGLASTPHFSAAYHAAAPVPGAGHLLEKEAGELARLANSASEHEAAIGMAALNSLLDVNRSRCIRLNASDLIAEKGRGKRVAIVGHFPFVPKLREVVRELWVIEKAPREGDFVEDAAPDLIPKADLVAITGTAFTNHTIDYLLGLCNPRAFKVVLGDTSPLSPVLFDHGVDAVSGTRVDDIQQALLCVSQGATFRQMRGIELLTLLREKAF
jgi:hypothetical protein